MRARTALNAKMMALRAAALAYLRAEGVAAAHGVRAQCSPGAVRGGVIATASKSRKPLRCHWTTVAGLTSTMASRTCGRQTR